MIKKYYWFLFSFFINTVPSFYTFSKNTSNHKEYKKEIGRLSVNSNQNNAEKFGKKGKLLSDKQFNQNKNCNCELSFLRILAQEAAIESKDLQNFEKSFERKLRQYELSRPKLSQLGHVAKVLEEKSKPRNAEEKKLLEASKAHIFLSGSIEKWKKEQVLDQEMQTCYTVLTKMTFLSGGAIVALISYHLIKKN